MTVADLIEKLGQFPPDAEVVQFDDDGYNCGEPDPVMVPHNGKSVVSF